MTTAVLVEVDVRSPAGAASTLRFCDRPVRPFPPTDPDVPNIAWDDRLVTAPTVRRTLFEDLENLTPGVSVGVMELANADGGLNAYQSYAWGQIRVYLWSGGAYSTAGRIIKARADVPSFSAKGSQAGRVRVGFYDSRIELDQPLQQTNFSGATGALYEGTVDGLKNTPKPLAYGRLDGAQVPAPQVNSSVMAHQLHDGSISGSLQIFDRGAAAGFANGGDYATNATFDAATPAAATYVTQFNRGLLKINGSPVGNVTFGFRGDNTGGYVETAGPIVRRVLIEAGIADTSIAAAVAAYPSTAVLGVWVGDSTSARDVVARIARSVGAAVLPRRDGAWTMLPIAAPAAVADYTIAADEIVDVDDDGDTPAPKAQFKIGYARNFTVFKRSELAPALLPTDAAMQLVREYRYAWDLDAGARAAYPKTAGLLHIDTDLRLEADAVALAANLKALFGLRADGKARRRLRVVLEMVKGRLSVDLGSTIQLTYPPAAVDDRFILIGEEPMRPKSSQVTWTLWG